MDAVNRMVDAQWAVDGVEPVGWRPVGATLREALNEPYVLTLDLLRDQAGQDAQPFLGRRCTLRLSRGGVDQTLHGIVTRVRDEEEEADHGAHARLTIEPAFAALRHRIDTRIFQDMTIPQILERVLGQGLGPFGRSVSLDLRESYPAREFTVQYRESDLDFACRLMEEEGIGFHFEHPDEAEVLTLFDAREHHAAARGEDGHTLPFSDREDGWRGGREHVLTLSPERTITGTGVSTNAFDWTHPERPIVGTTLEAPEQAVLEDYVVDAPITLHDYAGAYRDHDALRRLRVHRELQTRDGERFAGRTTSLALRAGVRWALSGHPRFELDRELVVTEVEHRWGRHTDDAGDEAADGDYLNVIRCLPAETPWRPDRVRPKPRAYGLQTAIVVGPPSEEIHTDEHGRIKVHFHWDRHGNRTDADSCWLRVVQNMGGSGWGFSFVPRIGMEVAISFVDGDPDRPIVTGAIYNPDNPPPLNLPENKTRTTIRSNSSPGGGGFNELRLEDLAGHEEIFLHGQKDWNTIIRNDLTRSVGHDEAQQVTRNRSRSVGVDESVSVGRNRQHSVGESETIQVGTDRVRQVGRDEDVLIQRNATHTILGSLTRTIKDAFGDNIAKSLVQNIGINRLINVLGFSETQIVLHEKRQIGTSRETKIGEDDVLDVKGDWNVKVGGKVRIEAGDASITLEDGNITIAGADIILEGSGQIVERATGDVAINGATIKLNC
ncbi:MAG: type VI secretion system tip protein TssI/VgrG [Myxococcota bacterium]|nr:type VI secretion system tip protein TssI/VgrG [Myxococcota bacterium]